MDSSDCIERPVGAEGLLTAADRAAIALAAVAGADSIETIAARHGVTPELVTVWRDRLVAGAIAVFEPPPRLLEYQTPPAFSVLDDIDVCVAVLEGDDLRYAYANSCYRALTNDDQPLLGRRLRDVFPIAKDDGVEAGMLQVLATGTPWHVTRFSAATPLQPDAVWEGHVYRIRLPDSDAPAVLVWVRNITGAARAEDAVREELALLRAISDSSDDVIFAKDVDGRLRFANPATLAVTGKPFEAIAGLTDAEFLDDADAAAAVMRNDRRIMETGVAENVEEVVPMPDGSQRTWLSSKRPYRDESGRVVGLLGISRDITARKTQEEQVRQAHAALQRVLDSMTDGLAILDRDWRYTYFSETGARMLGIRSADLVGRVLWEAYPEAEHLPFGREYRRAVETGIATHFEAYYPEPLNVWLECHCYPSPDGLSVYFRDVSERRRAEQAADESRRRVDAMLEATPVGLAYADAGGHLVMMNAECRRLWGNPPAAESVDGYVEFKGWWADGSERHGQALGARDWPMARALSGEQVVDTTIEIQPFDAPGVRRTCVLRAVPIFGADGSITGAVTAQTDITDFVEAKAALEASSQQLRQLANTIPQLAWMADATGSIHWYNDRWYAYTGTTAADMQGWGWQAVHDPDVLPAVLENWTRSIRTGERFEMTFPLRGADGRFRPFFTLVEPLRDAAGNVVQWFGTNTDVSAIEAVQAELRTTQHWLQAGLEAGRMVAWEQDLATRRVRYSDNVSEVMGYTSEPDTAGWASIDPVDRERLQGAITRALEARGTFDEVTRRTRPDDGRALWVRTKGFVICDDAGKPHTLRGILIDVTESMARQRALEQADERKDEFLAMLAHELRNPLAPITTAAHLLAQAPLDIERVQLNAEIIARQARHMTSLVDDLLDVSRVTRGLVHIEWAPVSVQDVIDCSVEQSVPLIESRGHTLVLPIEPVAASVCGDRIRLCQIVVNMLNNAAKYTPEGGRIEVRVTVENGEVGITVIDNGIGIDADLLPHVFELFSQASRAADRAQGGLGLGLALVDSLAKKHGGRVEANSAGAGCGSRFTVWLPTVLEVVPSAQRQPTLEEGGAGPLRSVLIVDDNVDATLTLQMALEMDGHDVTAVHRPSEALEALQKRSFDVAILDVGLPEMDGYALAQQLRNISRGAGMMLIALTGYGQAQDRLKSEAAGFDHHMVKPVDLKQLSSLLASARMQD